MSKVKKTSPSRQTKGRSKSYETPIQLKDGVTFMDVIKTSVKDAKSRDKKKP